VVRGRGVRGRGWGGETRKKGEQGEESLWEKRGSKRGFPGLKKSRKQREKLIILYNLQKNILGSWR